MQHAGILRIGSKSKIEEFLNDAHTGRIASIDSLGFPQIIPMNYAYVDGFIYMHSHIRGEKLDNITSNDHVGFEVDRQLEFLPSYFEHPTDASLADTLYISVVIKGTAQIIDDRVEKTRALNALMLKYQPEGMYEPIRPDMAVVDAVSIIRIKPLSMDGKYKIGQHLTREKRQKLAELILSRNTSTAKDTLRIMGFDIVDGMPHMSNDDLRW